MIDRSEITSLLYQRNKLMLDYDRKKQFSDAMMCAGTLSLHYNALSIEYQRLAAEAVKHDQQIPQDTQD